MPDKDNGQRSRSCLVREKSEREVMVIGAKTGICSFSQTSKRLDEAVELMNRKNTKKQNYGRKCTGNGENMKMFHSKAIIECQK